MADSALSSTENLQTLAKTGRPWIPRAPATITEAQDALAHADPETMSLWGRAIAIPCWRPPTVACPNAGCCATPPSARPQAQHSVDQPWRQQSEAAAQAFQTLCRTPFACEADAQQALATFAHGVQAASLYEGTLQPRRRYGKRGRPGQDALPPQGVSHLTGALTSSLAAHEALVAPQSCLILAINELDEPLGLPPELLAGSKGQAHAERGFGS